MSSLLGFNFKKFAYETCTLWHLRISHEYWQGSKHFRVNKYACKYYTSQKAGPGTDFNNKNHLMTSYGQMFKSMKRGVFSGHVGSIYTSHLRVKLNFCTNAIPTILNTAMREKNVKLNKAQNKHTCRINTQGKLISTQNT